MNEPAIHPLADADADADTMAALLDLEGWDLLVAAGDVSTDASNAADASVVAVTRAAAAQMPPLPSHRVSRRARRIALVGGLVAAVSASAILLPAVTRAPSASAEASSLLTGAADAIHTADPVARPSQWWRITTRSLRVHFGEVLDQGTSGPATSVLTRSDSITYVAVDGSRPTVTELSPERFVAQVSGSVDVARDPAWLFAGGVETSDLAPNAIPPSWQAPTPAFLASLPRDSDSLRERLYSDSAGSGVSPDGEVLVTVADVLRSGLVPADLRAALYRVLATVPGVEITTATATVDGVRGVGLGRLETVNGLRQEMVVDPATGEFIGEREVAVRVIDNIPAGTVLGQTRSTRSLVDEIPASVLARAHRSTCVIESGGVGCQG